MRRRLASFITALVMLGCTQHPCGDHPSPDLPEPLAGLSLVHDGGRVCSADADPSTAHAAVMYWGEGVDELTDTYATAIAASDWQPIACPELPQSVSDLCFARGKERLELQLEQTETARFARRFTSPSMKVDVYYWNGEVNATRPGG